MRAAIQIALFSEDLRASFAGFVMFFDLDTRDHIFALDSSLVKRLSVLHLVFGYVFAFTVVILQRFLLLVEYKSEKHDL